jgi:hypothetical protein
MKIDQLLKREPFGRILTGTLDRYIGTFDLGHKGGLMSWRPSVYADFFGRGRHRSGQRWFCNPRLNVIFPGWEPSSGLKAIKSQFQNSPFWLRRWLQRGFVEFATRPDVAPWLCSYVLESACPLPFDRDTVLCGGNTKIRLFSPGVRRITELRKEGTDGQFMQAELTVLRNPGLMPVPRLLKAADDASWYEVEYIEGVGVDRLLERSRIPRLVDEAARHLLAWQIPSRQEISALEYASQLKERISRSAAISVVLSDEIKSRINQWSNELLGLLEKLQSRQNLQVVTAVGHGDFQMGNIVTDHTNQIWIIDWEHSARRQWLYDVIVLGLNARFPRGLAGRFCRAVDHPEILGVPYKAFREFQKCRPLLVASMAIFLLEEIQWAVKENSHPSLLRPSGSWLGLRLELPVMIRKLTA